MNLLAIYNSEFDLGLRSQVAHIKNGMLTKPEVESLYKLRSLNPLVNYLSSPITRATKIQIAPRYGLKFFKNKYIATINLEVVDLHSKSLELELSESKLDVVDRELAPYFLKIKHFADVINGVLDQYSDDTHSNKNHSTAYRLKSEFVEHKDDIVLDNIEDLKLFELVLKLAGFGFVAIDTPSKATIIRMNHENPCILNSEEVFVRDIKIDDLSKNNSNMKVHFYDKPGEKEVPATITFNPKYFEIFSKRYHETIRVKMVSSRLTIYRRMKHPDSYDLIEILN